MGNPDDPLNTLEKYSLIYRLRGAPMTVFWWAQHMYWRENKARTEPLLHFLLDVRNPDDFSVGAAHFFLGLLYENVHKNYETAFSHYMRSVAHKTCLVFIGYAYYNAAHILTKISYYRNALALLAVDVPSIDQIQLSAQKHILAANILFNNEDPTNAVMHLHTALLIDNAQSNSISALTQSFYVNSALWNTCTNQKWSTKMRDSYIITGITNVYTTPDDTAYLDALSLDWPSYDALPKEITTNRTLNNVVFAVPRKDYSFYTNTRNNNAQKNNSEVKYEQ